VRNPHILLFKIIPTQIKNQKNNIMALLLLIFDYCYGVISSVSLGKYFYWEESFFESWLLGTTHPKNVN
jgi:hypothetical protein